MSPTDTNSLALQDLTDMLLKHALELLDAMDHQGADFFALSDMCLELQSILKAIEDQNWLHVQMV